MARSGSNLLLKGVGALVVLVVVAWLVLTLLQIVFGIVSWILSVLFTLALLGIVGFGIYWMASKLLGGERRERAGRSRADDFDLNAGIGGSKANEARDGRDPVEKLREEYASGRISEAEFERKLEQHLSTRSLEREVGTAEDRETERN